MLPPDIEKIREKMSYLNESDKSKKCMCLWGINYHYPMRLLMLRVPKEIAEKRRKQDRTVV